jgi:hypothetical protein
MGEHRRVADLRPGDLTSHAGGGCCGVPFRVEASDQPAPRLVEVTWACTSCGTAFAPLPCFPDVLVTFYGSGVAP